MSPIKVDIVTAEKVVYSNDVDIIIAPGSEGQLGILPNHSPLMTTLEPGELIMRKAGEEYSLAIAGGFMEVRPDRVIILADAAERADEIDMARAELAKQKARESITHHEAGVDISQAEASLRRALARIKVAEKRRRRTKTI
jgi:F-type H+-transporting ATPase subunit epsilon